MVIQGCKKGGVRERRKKGEEKKRERGGCKKGTCDVTCLFGLTQKTEQR
jgi:hypothetical protein